MIMHIDEHDFGEKTILNGVIIPARPPSIENAYLDVEDFITAVFEHPSTAPFISKALIQFLVTDNPSPGYIEHVASVFTDNGSGVRGDMEAVIKAILLTPEAYPSEGSTALRTHGRLREPFLRYMHTARILKLAQYEQLQWWDFGEFKEVSAQQPFTSPSVFNFYSPDYAALSSLRDNGLVGPVFEITNSYTAVSFPNELWDLINNGIESYNRFSYPPDFIDLLGIATEVETLLDYVNVLCCSGRMSAKSREIILDALNQLDSTDLQGRVKLALYLGIMSPEGSVQK